MWFGIVCKQDGAAIPGFIQFFGGFQWFASYFNEGSFTILHIFSKLNSNHRSSKSVYLKVHFGEKYLVNWLSLHIWEK